VRVGCYVSIEFPELNGIDFGAVLIPAMFNIAVLIPAMFNIAE
jgi:hypothetical protein